MIDRNTISLQQQNDCFFLWIHPYIAHQPHSIKTKIINLCLNRSIWFGNLFINFAISCGFILWIFPTNLIFGSSVHRNSVRLWLYHVKNTSGFYSFVICGNKKNNSHSKSNQKYLGKKKSHKSLWFTHNLWHFYLFSR